MFDFYSVWTPDKFSEYISLVAQKDPASAQELQNAIFKYNVGLTTFEHVVSSFKFYFKNLDEKSLKLKPENVIPPMIEFMRYSHSHFLKVGLLANVGQQEYDMLNTFNEEHQLLEVISTSLDMGGSVLSKEAFVDALQKIGEPPESCLVVTGHDDYQAFAKSCGMPVLRFQNFVHLQDTLDELINNGK